MLHCYLYYRILNVYVMIATCFIIPPLFGAQSFRYSIYY